MAGGCLRLVSRPFSPFWEGNSLPDYARGCLAGKLQGGPSTPPEGGGGAPLAPLAPEFHSGVLNVCSGGDIHREKKFPARGVNGYAIHSPQPEGWGERSSPSFGPFYQGSPPCKARPEPFFKSFSF